MPGIERCRHRSTSIARSATNCRSILHALPLAQRCSWFRYRPRSRPSDRRSHSSAAKTPSAACQQQAVQEIKAVDVQRRCRSAGRLIIAIMMPTQPATSPRSGALPDKTAASIFSTEKVMARRADEQHHRAQNRNADRRSSAPKTRPSATTYGGAERAPGLASLRHGSRRAQCAERHPRTPNGIAGWDRRSRSSRQGRQPRERRVGIHVKVNGSSIAVPVRPPMPGMMPSTRPMMQPSPNIGRATISSWEGLARGGRHEGDL